MRFSKKMIFISMFLIGSIPQLAIPEDSMKSFQGVLPGEIIESDPHKAISTSDGIVNSLVFEGLVRMVFPKVEPSVAREWKYSDDLLTWEFTLNQGVFFHNGQELTAADVVTSFRRILTNDKLIMHSVFAGKLADIKAIGKYNVRFTLNYGGSIFLQELALGVRSAILPSDCVGENGELLKFIGTGPYEYVHKPQKSFVSLKKSERHREQLKTAGMVNLRAGDSDKALSLLRNGVNWVYDVPFSQVKILTKSNMKIGQFNNGNHLRLSFNHQKQPFNDVRVRKAVALVIDRTQINERVFAGMAKISNQPFPEGSDLYLNVKSIEQNEIKARELLLEAGYSNGVNVVAVNPIGYLEEFWNIASKQLAAVGILVKVELVEASVAVERLHNMDYDLFLIGQSHPYHWSRVYDYYEKSSSSNWLVGGYHNPVVDSLIESARREKDIQSTRLYYEKVLQVLQDDVASVFLYQVPIVHTWTAGAADTANRMVEHADP